jgi:hypothetical protein
MDICHVLFKVIGRAFPFGKIPRPALCMLTGDGITRNGLEMTPVGSADRTNPFWRELYRFRAGPDVGDRITAIGFILE